MRTLLLTFSLFLSSNLIFAQSNINWVSSLSNDQGFIENKGQFDGFAESNSSEIRYALDGGNSMILFTNEGFTFRFTKKIKNKNRTKGDETKPKYLEEKEIVSVKWIGINKQAAIVSEEILNDKHFYASGNMEVGSTIENVNGFAKLVYKNAYPKIDIEFTVHPISGIKYDIILHPGADPSRIKMTYTSKSQPVIDTEGNVIISTEFGDIIDHAPSTSYSKSGNKINSKFKLDGNTVRFELGGYSADQEVVIDPWVQTPAFPNSGGIWDIDVDDLGNVYVYGGDTPMRLRKYDALGNILWTYNTPWDSANYWIGTMITEPTTGDCFITAGTDPRISRISTAGNLLWTASGGAFDEYWKFSFNCDFTRLMLGGTRLSLGGGVGLIDGYGYVFEINMSNGAQIGNLEVASVTPGPLGLASNPNEVRAMCPSPNGKYYFMTLDSIGSFDDNLVLGYKDNHGYGFSYQVAGYGVTNQSINAMVATTDYLYTQNGAILHKRNIVDGSIISSVPIPSGTTSSQLGFASAENGGLAIDSCGNLYAGSGNGVYKFDENLNPLGSQTTSNRVYDVAVNRAGEVVACGQGFVASLNLTPCAPAKAICLNCLELSPLGPYCQTDGQDTLVASAPGIWTGPGIIDQALGIFDPAVADTGTHVIHFAPEIPFECGIDSLVIEVNYCVDLLACVNLAGDITVSEGTAPYTWSQLIDTVDCSTCIAFPGFGPCDFPPGCSVASTMWVEFATDTTITPTGNWPIMVEDAEGNALEINSVSELPACESGCFLSVNLPPQVIACTGDSAIATAAPTGVIGTALFSWNTVPVQTTATAVGLVPGNYYTVTVTDDSSCVAIDSVFVVEQECIGPVVCVNPFNDLMAEGIAPFTWFQFVSSTDCSGCFEVPGFPPCSFPPGCAVTINEWQQFATGEMATPTGNWPIAVLDGVGDTLFINSLSELPACAQICYISVDVPAQAFVCNGQSNGEVTANVSGAFGTVSYSWNTAPVQTTATATGLAVGTYIVTVTDDNSCLDSDTVEVEMLPQILLQSSGTDSLCLGVTVGSASVIATGGAGSYQYSWNTSPVQTSATATGLGVGSYTVTVTDLTGCTSMETWSIEERISVLVQVGATDDICVGSTDGTATASASNGSGNYTYSWNTTPVQNGATASGLSSGTYQVTATDVDGCQGVASVTIGTLLAVAVDAGPTTSICLGQQTDLLATGGISYLWNTGETTASITVMPTETTLYEVTATDNNNCEASDTVTVFVVAIPQVTIVEPDSLVCDVEQPFQLVGNPTGGTFSGTGVNSDGMFDPMAAGNGAHVVTYTFGSVANCDVDTSVVIVVDEHLCDVIAPNVFNPNSDFSGQADFCGNVPQNNVFSLPCLEWYPGNRVRIFDRWGIKQYDQIDYHLKPWTGDNQSDGIYYYILEIQNEETIKGFFHLIR
ncbi:MAG: gliding motility-associated C-terminal domain-containing protein [Flavobacteriales bacterium]|nr:gliding motility-associated C-terminal domain-containing protein [Flavobacteriales bacterium]